MKANKNLNTKPLMVDYLDKRFKTTHIMKLITLLLLVFFFAACAKLTAVIYNYFLAHID